MDRNEVVRLIYDELREWNYPEEDISEKSSLQKDLHLDSLDKLYLVVNCEDKLEVQLPDDVISQIDTVEDLIAAMYHEVQKKKSKICEKKVCFFGRKCTFFVYSLCVWH